MHQEILYKQNWSLRKYPSEKQLHMGDIQAAGMEVACKSQKKRERLTRRAVSR